MFELPEKRVHRLDGVCARLLLHRYINGVAAVVLTREGVVLLADFDARYILEPHNAALVVAANHYLVELFRRHEAPFRDERIRKCAVILRRGSAHRAERRLDILLGNGAYHLFRVHRLRRHALGVEPHAHGELGPVNLSLAHARHTQKDRLDVLVGVVRKR